MNREPRRPIPTTSPTSIDRTPRPEAAVTAPGHLAQARAGQPEHEARGRRLGAPALHNPAMADRGPADRRIGRQAGRAEAAGRDRPAAAAHTRRGGAAARGAGVLAAPQSRRPGHPVHLPRQTSALLPG